MSNIPIRQGAKNWMRRLLLMLAYCFAIYLIGFWLILVDELYLETKVIAKHRWMEESLKILYWPILHNLK